MGILFQDVSRRQVMKGGAKAVGAITISTAIGGRMAHATVDTSQFAQNGKVKFGTILPLSGDFTVVSQPWIHAIKIAIDEVNAAGGVKVNGTSYQIDNPIGDEMYTAAGALSAYKSMVADGCHYYGGLVSIPGQAAVQGVNIGTDSLIVEALTGKDLSLTNNNLRFFEYSLAQATGPYMADYAFNVLKVRKAGSIEIANTWGEDFFKSFAATFQELGGQVVSRSYMEITQTDYSAQISDLLNSGADMLYIIVGDGPGTAIGVQARQGGLTNIPFLAEGAWGPEMLQQGDGGTSLDGTVYPGARPYVIWDAQHQAYSDKLHADAGIWLNNWFWHGYESTKIVLWAMEKANSLDPRDVVKAIPAVVDERGKGLMIRAQGTVVTADKGVFLKIPMYLGRFNSKADFLHETTLVPVQEAKYLGFPGWMPANWAGYTASPDDKSVNWYPTMSELTKMRSDAGEDNASVGL
jgi:branched-chain amino acid transport system substrate-binding protein